MTQLSRLVLLLLTGLSTVTAAESTATLRREPSPPASGVSQQLFWIADTAKMDRFLEQVDLANIREGSYAGEVLPDTRVAWRDYVRQARNLAATGKNDDAIFRIWQMLKLAAVYRDFGGLQNVVQGEEIRALAGKTSQELNFGGRIKSPYLEYNIEECIALIERQAGREKNEVRSSFWQRFIESAGESFVRLTTPPSRTAQLQSSIRN